MSEQEQTNGGQEIPPKKKRATTRRGTKKPAVNLPASAEPVPVQPNVPPITPIVPAEMHPGDAAIVSALDETPEETVARRIQAAKDNTDPLLAVEYQRHLTNQMPAGRDPFSVADERAYRDMLARRERSEAESARQRSQAPEQATIQANEPIGEDIVHGVTSVPGTPINAPRVEEPERGSLAGIIPEGLGSASTIVRARPTRKLPESRSTTEIPVVLGGGTPTFRGDYPRHPTPEALSRVEDLPPKQTKRLPFAIPRMLQPTPLVDPLEPPTAVNTPFEQARRGAHNAQNPAQAASAVLPAPATLPVLPAMRAQRKAPPLLGFRGNLPGFHAPPRGATAGIGAPPPPFAGAVAHNTLPSIGRTRSATPSIAPPSTPVAMPAPAGSGGNNTTVGQFAGLGGSLAQQPANQNIPPILQTQQTRFQPSIVTGIPSSILLFAGLALVAVNAVNQVFGAASATGVSVASFVLGIQPIAQSGGILNKLPANMFGTILAETALVLFLTLVVAKISSFFNYTVTGIIALFWLAWLVENGAKLAGIWKGFVSGFPGAVARINAQKQIDDTKKKQGGT